jgi:predicted transcriptional regulator YdeE
MPTANLRVVEFGPFRAIGVSCIPKNASEELPQLWKQQIGPRYGEIRKPPHAVALGICRCVPGATDGSFEYIAAFEATADAPIPAGMIEVHLPRCDYAVFEVASLAEVGAAWRGVPAAMAAQHDWEPYCGSNGCQCATHPGFEYYPRTFPKDGRLQVYVPVRKA